MKSCVAVDLGEMSSAVQMHLYSINILDLCTEKIYTTFGLRHPVDPSGSLHNSHGAARRHNGHLLLHKELLVRRHVALKLRVGERDGNGVGVRELENGTAVIFAEELRVDAGGRV